MILDIMMKDLRVTIRDKQAFVIMILMPLILIFALGMGLAPMFESDTGITKFSIGVVNHDNGLYSASMINDFLRSEEMQEIFDTYLVSENKGMQMLEENIVPAIIIIPENYSENIKNKKNTGLKMIKNAERPMSAEIVSSIADGYASRFSSFQSAGDIIYNALNEEGVNLQSTIPGMSPSTNIMLELAEKSTGGNIDFSEADLEENRTISAIQYYAAGMLVMFILFGVLQGIRVMLDEREQGTLKRMLSARGTRRTIILGKFLGLIVIGMGQSTIIILFTYLTMGVNWGNDILGIILLTLSTVFAGAGGAMLIAAVSKTAKTADGMGMIFIQGMAMIGGSTFPLYVMPSFMKVVSKFTINGWALRGYLSLMMGGTSVSILTNCAVLVVMGIIFLSIGVATIRID